MRNKFTVSAGALASAVKYAAKRLDPKPTIPEHGCLMFEVDGDRLNVYGYSENATAKAVVEIDASDEPKGAFLVAGRLIAALVETFPDKPVTFEQEGSIIAVTAGRFRATLPAMNEKDYPLIPGTAPLAGHVDGATLADAARRVGVAASRDTETRVALCGIHVRFGEYVSDPITLMTTDTYRAARQTVPWAGSNKKGRATSASTVILAATMLDAVDAFTGLEQVAIGWEGDENDAARGVFSLSTSTRSLVTRVYDPKDFPAAQLEPIFDRATTATATIRVKDLLLPIKRANLLRGKEVDSATIRFSENLATIVTSGMNGADEEVDIAYDGPETTMVVRTAPLMGALSSAPGEVTEMHFDPGTTKPAIVTAPADPTWRHMIVPLRPTGGNS